MIVRKRRTRAHEIADLSVNHVERFVLQCGHSVLRTHGADYGVDLFVYIHAADGQIENSELRFQIKATDSLRQSADGSLIVADIATSDLRYWSGELWPVILVIFDALADRAYWIDIKEYHATAGLHAESMMTKTHRIRIPASNRFSRKSVRSICRLTIRPLKRNP